MAINFLKAACLSLCTLGTAGLASAQDRIYLNDGGTLDVKVKEVNQRSIVYRRWDNQEGADYVLTRREVEKIVYENGTEEVFEQQRSRFPAPPRPGGMRSRPRADSRDDSRDESPRAARRGMNPAYGRNILAIAGIQMTNSSTAGVGIHYERILDKEGVISLYLPIAFSFYQDNAFRYFGPGGNVYDVSRVFTYAYPGIKFYPGGSGRRFSYSVGPSFGLGVGTAYRERNYYNPGSGFFSRTVTEETAFRAGFMVNNGLNIQATPQLYIGTELGLGITYYDNTREDYVIGEDGFIQFNFKIGYRF